MRGRKLSALIRFYWSFLIVWRPFPGKSYRLNRENGNFMVNVSYDSATLKLLDL
jgi:hypothetical protein